VIHTQQCVDVLMCSLQVLLKHGRQPDTVLIDLPCTLFMMDNRNLTMIEEIAKMLDFSPRIKVCLPCLDDIMCGARN
jgi:hypothetical protein